MAAKVKSYATWKEASNATQELVIESVKEYKKRHLEDSKLPDNPKEFYRDYPGDDIFFGLSQTL